MSASAVVVGVLVAQAVVAGASAAQQSSAAKSQFITDEAATNLASSQNMLASRQKAAFEATRFRKALASQVSLASFRGGAGSLVRQFGFESFRSHSQNQATIGREIVTNRITAMNQLAGASGRLSAARTQAFTGAITQGLSSALGAAESRDRSNRRET